MCDFHFHFSHFTYNNVWDFPFLFKYYSNVSIISLQLVAHKALYTYGIGPNIRRWFFCIEMRLKKWRSSYIQGLDIIPIHNARRRQTSLKRMLNLTPQAMGNPCREEEK